MKETPQTYYRALGFIFLFEGFSQSLLYSIGPLLMTDQSLSKYIEHHQQANTEQIHSESIINEYKGYIAFHFAFYLLIYYLFQLIGMFFWSKRIDTVNIKYIIITMISVSSLSVLVISMKVSFPLLLAMRAFQGFFTSGVGIVKLTIDNKFQPKRDMRQVIDLTGFWFFGLALGTTTTGILSNPQRKFYSDFSKMLFIKKYPFILPSIANLILAIILIIIILTMLPSKTKKQYKKLQSTMFFQTIFFLSQNEFTSIITRHQRTRETFRNMTIKKIICQDRNFIFALIHSAIAYFIFFGFLEIFTLYCFTVLDIKNELFISIVHSAAMFCVFIYEIFYIDVNFFERSEIPRRTNKDLAMTWILALISLSCLYLLRSLLFINNYLFLIIVCVTHITFCVSFCHILSFNHYLIEQTALQCGDDADHARNFTQFCASLAKVFGPFLFAFCVSFNFWQLQDIYIDFIYAFVFALVLIIVAYLILSCLDINWRQPELEQQYTKKLLDSTTSHDVFA